MADNKTRGGGGRSGRQQGFLQVSEMNAKLANLQSQRGQLQNALVPASQAHLQAVSRFGTGGGVERRARNVVNDLQNRIRAIDNEFNPLVAKRNALEAQLKRANRGG